MTGCGCVEAPSSEQKFTQKVENATAIFRCETSILKEQEIPRIIEVKRGFKKNVSRTDYDKEE